MYLFGLAMHKTQSIFRGPQTYYGAMLVVIGPISIEVCHQDNKDFVFVTRAKAFILDVKGSNGGDVVVSISLLEED